MYKKLPSPKDTGAKYVENTRNGNGHIWAMEGGKKKTSRIDDILKESGFKRRSNSLIYSRTIGTTKQKLDMVFYSHPPYYAGALLHIYPYMSVYFPEINKTAENMISNMGTMTIQQTMREPIQMKAFGTTPWILSFFGDRVLFFCCECLCD